MTVADLELPGLWSETLDLGLAFLLSSLIGLEREYRQKSAGLRTHTLVGVGTALFVLVSKYGFADVLYDGITRYDPARVAAQIVSGIGFIGGGLIFVRRDAVRGLTTAATIWLTCAVGMACGAHLYWLAVVATGMHFVIAVGYPPLARRLPFAPQGPTQLILTYGPGRMVLAEVLRRCTEHGFVVLGLSVDRRGDLGRVLAGNELLREEDEGLGPPPDRAVARVRVTLKGRVEIAPLLTEFAETPGLVDVRVGEDDAEV